MYSKRASTAIGGMPSSSNRWYSKQGTKVNETSKFEQRINCLFPLLDSFDSSSSQEYNILYNTGLAVPSKNLVGVKIANLLVL